MKHIRSSKIFEARKRPEGPKLRNVDDLDEDIKQIFLPLIDFGYNLEVLHQYSTSNYTLFFSNSYYQLFDQLRRVDNLLDDSSYMWIEKDYENYLNILLLISKELPEIRGRVKDIVGLTGFDISNSGTISITFEHEPQGHKNLGSKMLAGDPSKSIYE